MAHFAKIKKENEVLTVLTLDDKDMKNEDGVEHEINLDVGDIVIYSGRRHEHWRNPYEGNKIVQAFLQYVEADGPYSHLKWDTKPALGLPAEFVRQEIKDEVQNVKDMLGFKR